MMKKRTVAAIALTTAFGVYSCKDTELTAPMTLKSGKQGILACTDPQEKVTHFFSTMDTIDVWRPFGRNTREFTDIFTQEKKVMLEKDFDRMYCSLLPPATVKGIVSAMKPS